MSEYKRTPFPSVGQLEQELSREKNKKQYRKVLLSTVYMLITVAAIAVLVATLWMPVLQIYGTSMTPTLRDGDIVVSVKGTNMERYDLCAFYVNDKILVKRVIAGPGEWVTVSEDGSVFVNDQKLNEPYVYQLSLGECDIDFPLQVPDGQYFVLGDHRAESMDSRNSDIGCIPEERIVGKIVFRVWPIQGLGILD